MLKDEERPFYRIEERSRQLFLEFVDRHLGVYLQLAQLAREILDDDLEGLRGLLSLFRIHASLAAARRHRSACPCPVLPGGQCTDVSNAGGRMNE
jgi:hypothetical protein